MLLVCQMKALKALTNSIDHHRYSQDILASFSTRQQEQIIAEDAQLWAKSSNWKIINLCSLVFGCDRS
jgi:hypothetical protein